MEHIKTYAKIMDSAEVFDLEKIDNFFDQTVGSNVKVEEFYEQHLRQRLLEAFNGVNSGLIILSQMVEESFTFLFGGEKKRRSQDKGILPLLFDDILMEYISCLTGASNLKEFYIEMSFHAVLNEDLVDLLNPISNRVKYDRAYHFGADISSIEGLSEKQLVIHDDYYEFMAGCYRRLLKLCKTEETFLSPGPKASDISTNIMLKIFSKDKNGVYRKARISMMNIFSCHSMSRSSSLESVNERPPSRSRDGSVFFSVVKALAEKKRYVPFEKNFLSECLKPYFHESRTTFVSLLCSEMAYTERELKKQSDVRRVKTSFIQSNLDKTNYELMYYRWHNKYIRKCIRSQTKPFQEQKRWKEKLMNSSKEVKQLGNDLAMEKKRRNANKSTLDRLRKKLQDREKLKNECQPCSDLLKKSCEMLDSKETVECSLSRMLECAERVNALEAPVLSILDRLDRFSVQHNEPVGTISLSSRRSLYASNIVEEVEDMFKQVQNTLPELVASLPTFDLGVFVKLFLVKLTLEDLIRQCNNKNLI